VTALAGRRSRLPFEPRHVRLLWLLAAASFFAGYDLEVITVALPQVRHTFGLTQATASDWLALLYLGALPALFLARRADRAGRRRMLLVSIAGCTIATAATAAAPTILTFALCQLAANAFLALDGSLSWTMLAEELPASARGFGFGVLATASALGAGTAALGWALLLSPFGLSWRWLYAAAAPVLLVMAVMRRGLPESSRFTAAATAGRLAASWRSLFRPPHGRLLTLVCAAAALTALLTQASVFVIDFMQTQRHLSPSAANLILVGAGALAIPVLIWAGSISDRLGRKRIGCSFLALSLAGALWFFFLAHGALGLFLALAVTFVGQFGAWPTLSGFTTELFPTSHRALASSAAGIATVVGQLASFLLAALLIDATGSLARSVAVLAAGPLIALILVIVGFPETAGRELEVTSAELPAGVRLPVAPVARPIAGPMAGSAVGGLSGQLLGQLDPEPAALADPDHLAAADGVPLLGVEQLAATEPDAAGSDKPA
jgi:SHS family lactate transporter-like MFS transporter